MTSRMKIYRLIAMMLLICASPKSSAEKKAQIKVDINSKDDAAYQAYGAMAAALQEAGRGDEVPNRAVKYL